ncbi:hypothetical protein V1478_000449 [Vespula squamosa]|uniref:Uncharacterized protein n=1 Tax=Vespula squamosa TaxID=30214 RepID=A0ABD2C5I6_VESSQ
MIYSLKKRHINHKVVRGLFSGIYTFGALTVSCVLEKANRRSPPSPLQHPAVRVRSLPFSPPFLSRREVVAAAASSRATPFTGSHSSVVLGRRNLEVTNKDIVLLSHE